MTDVTVANRIKPTVELYLAKCRSELMSQPITHENLVACCENLRSKWLTELENLVRQTEPSLGITGALLDSSVAADVRPLWSNLPPYINRIEQPPPWWATVTKRMAGGAATGAVVGSFIPIAGTILGAATGAIFGGQLGVQSQQWHRYYNEVKSQHVSYFSKFSDLVNEALIHSESPSSSKSEAN